MSVNVTDNCSHVKVQYFHCWTIDRRHCSAFDNGEYHMTAFRPYDKNHSFMNDLCHCCICPDQWARGVWLNHSFHEQWEGSVFKLKFAISCWFHIFYYQQCQEVFSSHCYFQMTGIYTSTRKSTTLVRILTFVLTLLIPMRRQVAARLSVLSVPLASHTTTSSTTWQVQTRLHWCTADCCITACVIHYCVCVCVYICCWSERAVKSSEVC